jgi:cytosine/adenosine deaminase-related metal-dependent hydrolase
MGNWVSCKVHSLLLPRAIFHMITYLRRGHMVLFPTHSHAVLLTHPRSELLLDSGMCNYLHQRAPRAHETKSVMCTSRCLEIYRLVDILDEKIQCKLMRDHVPHRHRNCTQTFLTPMPNCKIHLSQAGMHIPFHWIVILDLSLWLWSLILYTENSLSKPERV